MVVKLVAGLCHLSFALHAACNSSRNASRSNAGQLMYAGMIHPVMPQQRSCVAGLNSLEWVVIAGTGQEYSAKERQRARQHAVSVVTLIPCAVESHPTPGDIRGSSSPSRSISGVSSHVADGGSARVPHECVHPSLSRSSSPSRSIHSPEHHVIFHPSCSHHVPKVA